MLYTLDIETSGLELDATINFVGLYNPQENRYIIFHLPKQRSECIQFLESVKHEQFIYHNGKFDTKLIQRSLGVDMPITHDTEVLAYLLSTVPELIASKKSKGWLSLKGCAKRYLGVPDWDIGKKKTSTDPALVIPYLKYDLLYTWQLFDTLQALLPKEIYKTYKLIMHSLNVYKTIELNGMPIDLKQLEVTLVEYDTLRKNTLHELNYFKNINWRSAPQLQAYLYDELMLPVTKTTKTGQPSTDKEALAELLGEHPVIEVLLRLKDQEKAVTFLKDWKKRAVNSTLHGTFRLSSTVTGRTSCSEPNLQQVPRNKDLKRLFRSLDPEWEFVQFDYSQAELRFASIVANVEAIKQAYRNGEDLHTNMAAVIAGKERDKVSKADRTGAKAAKKLAANLTI